MKMLAAVAFGGAFGAVGRYWVATLAARMLGTGFPYGTLTVNIIGSFIMGVLVEAAALRLNLSPELRALLAVGVLGSFTTFSTFSLDVVLLFERHDNLLGILYLLASVILSVGALFCGLRLTRLVLL